MFLNRWGSPMIVMKESISRHFAVNEIKTKYTDDSKNSLSKFMYTTLYIMCDKLYFTIKMVTYTKQNLRLA